jgi:hypothetical protein
MEGFAISRVEIVVHTRYALWDKLPGVDAKIGPCIDEEPALAVLVGKKEAVDCRSADVSRRWRLQC